MPIRLRVRFEYDLSSSRRDRAGIRRTKQSTTHAQLPAPLAAAAHPGVIIMQALVGHANGSNACKQPRLTQRQRVQCVHAPSWRANRLSLAGPRMQPRVRALWDDSMALADLRIQLDAALEMEDYTLAARLRDAIQQRSVDVRLAVEDANTRFYDAFRSGNIKEMNMVWGEGDHVSVIHPGAECIAGRDAVLESWSSILAGVRPRAFKLDLEDVRIWAADGCGYVTCVEVVNADDSMGRVCVTNVFEKQKGRWVMVLHQGGPVPPRKRFRGFA